MYAMRHKVQGEGNKKQGNKKNGSETKIGEVDSKKIFHFSLHPVRVEANPDVKLTARPAGWLGWRRVLFSSVPPPSLHDPRGKGRRIPSPFLLVVGLLPSPRLIDTWPLQDEEEAKRGGGSTCVLYCKD